MMKKSAVLNAIHNGQNDATPNNGKNNMKRKCTTSPYGKENVDPSPSAPVNSKSTAPLNVTSMKHLADIEGPPNKKKKTQWNQLLDVASNEHGLLDLSSTLPKDLNNNVIRRIVEIDPFLSERIFESLQLLPERVQLAVSEFHELDAQLVVRNHHLKLFNGALNSKQNGQSGQPDQSASFTFYMEELMAKTVEQLLDQISITMIQIGKVQDLKIKKLNEILNLIKDCKDVFEKQTPPPTENNVIEKFKHEVNTKKLSKKVKPKNLAATTTARKQRDANAANKSSPPATPHSTLNKEIASLKKSKPTRKNTKEPKNETTSSDDEIMSTASSPSSTSSSEDYQYCVCKKQRFGTMIQCENQSACQFDWFHLKCVGLKKAPTGIWYCDTCKSTSKRKKSS